jgi:hypothetical protein
VHTLHKLHLILVQLHYCGYARVSMIRCF